MRFPLRFFLLSAVICLGIALFLQEIGRLSGQSLIRATGQTPDLSSRGVVLPSYLYKTGQPEQAIQELNKIIPSLPASEFDSAQADLEKLIRLQENPLSQGAFMLIRASWYWPPRFLAAALLLFGVFLVFLLVRLFSRRSLFIVVPFIDRAGLNLGADLPAAVLDRMRSISWQKINLKASQKVIAENLEIPSIGLVSEGDSLDTVALLETALKFSIGIGDLPLAKSLYSLRLWMEEPRYLVRGSLDKAEGHLWLNIQLIDRKMRKTEEVWICELASEQNRSSAIIDHILYPLLFHFSGQLGTNNWEALLALHTGLEEFQYFSQYQDRTYHLDSAVDHLAQALRLDPGYALAHYNLGLIQMAAGNYELAREHLSNASRMAKGSPLEYSATYNYGVALFQHAQDWAYERAIKTFQSLIDSKQAPAEFVLLARSSKIAVLAKMAGRGQKYPEDCAHQVFSEADALQGEEIPEEVRSELSAAKGYAYLAIKEFKEAQTAFDLAIQHNPNSINALIGLGEAYFRLNCHEEALGVLRQATVVSQAGGYAHYRLGNLYRQLKDPDGAVESYRRAPALPVAHLALGKVLFEQGHLREALEEFRTTTRLNRHLSDAWVNIAWTILELKDDSLLPEALSAAKCSVQTEKDTNQIWHRRAVLSLCQSCQGNYKLALKEAQSAVKLAPDQAQAHFVLGYAQQKLGKPGLARDSYKNVLVLDKNGLWKTEAERMLQTIENGLKEQQ